MSSIFKKSVSSKIADVCVIVEGSYPFVQGGVSSWLHNLILSHSDITFSIVAIIPPVFDKIYKYTLPANVIEIYVLPLHYIPKGKSLISSKSKFKMAEQIKKNLLGMYCEKDVNSFMELLTYLTKKNARIGKRILFNSTVSWEVVKDMYVKTMNNSSFIDYFWSWRILFGGLFSIILADLPKASCYHSLCTGYAGVYLAKAHFETNKPCILTEHGIYTNERRIEISTASWLYSQASFSLSVSNAKNTSGLQQMWTEIFSTYSILTYEACKYIITLYEGNRSLQIADGADPEKTMLIPNGVNFNKFSSIARENHLRPTVALIGRVVQIKDIKTYIQSLAILKKSIPDILGYVIGSHEEEPEYAKECFELSEQLNLNGTLIFTGNQDIADYLGKIDISILTSLSEAQPLVVLECGAAGIPSIATDVGSCRELIEGTSDENPKLGIGGVIVPLSNYEAIAQSMLMLFTDKVFYNQCAQTMKRRVDTYYRSELQHKRYSKIYRELITEGSKR